MASSAGPGGKAPPERGTSRELRMSIVEVAKKLSLWHTATFRPILTHDELEPVLAAAGFVPLPPAPTGREQDHRPPTPAAVEWREYAFLGGSGGANAAPMPRCWRVSPRPRLPYPRVDGLHLKTYQAFLAAVEACLGAIRVANLFHVRLMPVTNPDRVFDKLFRPMLNFTVAEEDGLIVYREGTLDDRTMEACSRHTAAGDVGHHVIPGISCRDLGYLRKLDGNCHEEGCCGAAKYPAAGYDSFFPVLLKDICPNLIG